MEKKMEIIGRIEAQMDYLHIAKDMIALNATYHAGMGMIDLCKDMHLITVDESIALDQRMYKTWYECKQMI